jgi:hypothetical protein
MNVVKTAVPQSAGLGKIQRRRHTGSAYPRGGVAKSRVRRQRA